MPSPERVGAARSRRTAALLCLVVTGCGGGTRAAASAASADGRDPEPARSTAPPPVSAPAIPGGLARGDGSPVDAHLRAGDDAFRRGELSDARGHYLAASAEGAEDPAPAVGLLRVRLGELGVPTVFGAGAGSPEVQQLLEQAEGVLAKAPDFAPAILERGRLLLVLGRGPEALAALRAAAPALSGDPEAQSALAVALLATGSVEESATYFEKAAALDASTATRHANVGTAYMIAGRVEEAIRAYRQAVSLAPNDARAHGDLGTAYLAAGRPKDALGHLDRAVSLEPRRATFLSNLGYAQQELGELGRARGLYERAVALDPTLGSAWINLGVVQAKLGSFDAAQESLEKARALDPEDPRVLENLRELDALRAEPHR